MTVLPRLLGAPALNLQATAIGATTLATHAQALASVANSAAMDYPTGEFMLDQPTGGAYSFSYTPGANIAFLRARWFFLAYGPGTVGFDAAGSVRMSVTDGTNYIPYTDGIFTGTGFDGSTVFTAPSINPISVLGTLGGKVDFDLAYAAATLSASVDWVVSFVVDNLSSGIDNLARIQAYELPRWSTDESSNGRGQSVGDFLTGVDIDDSQLTGVRRLVATAKAARVRVQPYYVQEAWIQSTSSTAPVTASGTDGPFTNWEESSGQGTIYTVPPRQIQPATSTSVPIRWRVLYCTTGSVSLTFTVHTGSSGSFSNTLADTSGSWVWSSWYTGTLDGTATLTPIWCTGLISAAGSGKAAYLGSVCIMGAEP